MTSGFVAGTVVHTKGGLIPIKDIKVGDLVLSRDENDPDGRLAFKSVTKVFKSTNKQPIIAPVDALDVLCTDSHPFWTENHGWVKAGDLNINKHKVMHLGYALSRYYENPIYGLGGKNHDPFNLGGLYLVATRDANVAFRFTDSDFEYISQAPYNLINFSNGIKNVGFLEYNDSNLYWILDAYFDGNCSNTIYLDNDQLLIDYYTSLIQEVIERDVDAMAYTDYVYNIEVEDYHTYFVGVKGYWVLI